MHEILLGTAPAHRAVHKNPSYYGIHSFRCAFSLCSMITVNMATIVRLPNFLLVKFIKHNQNYYLKFDVSTSIRGLHQKKLVLSSSGSS